MQKKIIIGVVGGLGLLMVLFFDGMSKNIDNSQKVTVPTGGLAVVAQQDKKSLISDEDSIKKANSLVSAITYTSLENESKNKSLKHSVSQEKEQITESSSIPSEQKLERALRDIPINYHSVLYWSDGQDQDLINEYSEVTENESSYDSELEDKNLEASLSDFIYQHELGTQITLENLGCSREGCIIYGVELQSGVWNQLIDFAKNQSEFTFSKDTTRSNVGTDGNLIFFTVIR
ncbi:MAG: hypothetical protein QNK36_08130 [Colwellia sp.]|nr:hypothetical protein [Colwellia sp.]